MNWSVVSGSRTAMRINRARGREGLATAYGETVVAQGEADPARYPITAYAAGVDQHERSLGSASNRETHVGQLLHQVGTPPAISSAAAAARLRAWVVRQATMAASAGVDTDQAGCCSRIAAISFGSPIT